MHYSATMLFLFLMLHSSLFAIYITKPVLN